ncbi:hypothetical protein BD626DRAFT_254503 [Schizophyllum amplum]|uniref:Uncharacterized protein n=1 Tax=Schizophyllum amplum TaxID=97359 RepID=A0A550CII8_9AGAR|nr:hypothetical protein BD626DRAFT_254503 [Auriculariopsis ampla]
MPRLPLLVVQYDISPGLLNHEHWGLVVYYAEGNGKGRVFEMSGTLGDFHFNTKDVNLFSSRQFCGGCKVGAIEENKMNDLETWLRAVPNQCRVNPAWNCQTWVVDAIRELQMGNRGVIFSPFSERALRVELAADKERSETGYNTIIEGGRAFE